MVARIQRPEDSFIKRILKAVRACERMKEPTDEKNQQMLRSYISRYHSKIPAKNPHPLNMLDRAVSIWLPFLVGGIPKILVEPKIDLALKPFAYTFQLALNQWLKNNKFDQRTLEPVVFNSLFSAGIIKTGTASDETKMIAGNSVVTGKPFSEVVDNSNYVFDIVARDQDEYEFQGDKYLLPTEEAKEMYPRYADKIEQDFLLYGENHPKHNENPNNVSYSELRKYTEFLDLWLPKERVIITILPPKKNCHKILKTVPYKGPDTGPYDVLGYKWISGSTIPIPPIYSLMELDTAINTLFSKAREGAERLKKIGVADGKDDAKTARDAAYGDMCNLANPEAVKEITLGGVVPEIWEFLGFSLAQFSEQSAVTGLDYRARAKTLGQEQILMTNATRILDFMSQKVHAFTSSIAEKLAFEMWRNPTLQIEAVMKVMGIGEVPVRYSQFEQEGSFLDYNLDIEMYSMQKLPPEDRFNKLWQILTGVILPLAPIAAQQGKQLNAEEIIKTLSLYANVNTDSFFLSEMPQDAQLNPYQPTGGVNRADTRFGSNTGDNLNNFLQSQMANQGKTTKE